MVAAQRTLIILKHLAVAPEGVSVRDLARKLACGPSSVQKSMQALVSQDFARYDGKTQRYLLGPAALQIALSGLTRLEIRRMARPHLERLVQACGETALLGIRDAGEAVYVEKAVSQYEVRMDPPIGARRPLNCTAVGKALLASLSDAEVQRLAEQGCLVKATHRSITDPQALRLEMAGIKERGYSVDREEFIEGAMCVGAPVRNHEGEVVAALAVSGPTARVQARVDQIVVEIVRSAQALSSELGHLEGLFETPRAPTPPPPGPLGPEGSGG